MIRFYLLPIEQVRIYSGPKYFHWRYDPDPPGIDCFWSKKDYGAAPVCVLAADIAPEAHLALSTLRDVYAFPLALDALMAPAEHHKLTRQLAKFRIPSRWTGEATICRSAIRTITCIFLYAERLTKIAGPFFQWPATLETRWCELSAKQKDWIRQAAWDFGYTLDFVTVNTQLQGILAGMAAQFGKRPISFKLTEV